MVLQAVRGDLQSLRLLPFTPSTYHLMWARAVGRTPNNVSIARHISFRDFIFPPIGVGEVEVLRSLDCFCGTTLLNTLAACVSVV
jgi:hypothetical protein